MITWGKAEGYVDSVEYLYMDYAAQITALQQGKVDVVAQLGTADLAALQAVPSLQVVTVPSGGYQTIVMQATEAPFTNPLVRQALKACADHGALQRLVLQTGGTTGNDHPVVSISPFWANLP